VFNVFLQCLLPRKSSICRVANARRRHQRDCALRLAATVFTGQQALQKGIEHALRARRYLAARYTAYCPDAHPFRIKMQRHAI